MSSTRETAAYSRDFLRIKVPYSPSDAATLSRADMESVVRQINQLFEQLFIKIYGRIASGDLNPVTQNLINNKLDEAGVATWVTQNASSIAALVIEEGVVGPEVYDSQSITRSTTAPASPTDGMYWLDTSTTPAFLKQYVVDGESGSWVQTGATVVKTTSGVTIDANGVLIQGATVSFLTSLFTVAIEADSSSGVINVTIDKNGIDAPKVTTISLRSETHMLAGREQVLRTATSYYFDPTQSGDGSASDNASPDLQALVDSIPRFLEAGATVVLASGSIWNHDLTIPPCIGKPLTITGNNAYVNGFFYAEGLTKLIINNLKIAMGELRDLRVEWYGGSINSAANSSSILGSLIWNSCTGWLWSVEINATGANTYGIYAYNNSNIQIINCTGDCEKYLSLDRGTLGWHFGTIPFGTVSYAPGLGQLSSSTNVTQAHGNTYVAPPAPSVYSEVVACADSRSHNSSYGWLSDEGIVQGEYVNGTAPYFHGHHTGCFWFDSFSVPSGYHVTGVRLYLRRINAGGYPSAQKVRLYNLTAPTSDTQGTLTRGTSVSNLAEDSDGVGYYLGTLNRDEGKWFDLPTAVATTLANGYGFCIYTTITSTTELPEYIQCHGFGTSYPPKMEITLTED